MLKKIEAAWKHCQTSLHTLLWEELHPLEVETIQRSLQKTLTFLNDNYKNTEAKIIHSLEEIARRLRQDDEDR